MKKVLLAFSLLLTFSQAFSQGCGSYAYRNDGTNMVLTYFDVANSTSVDIAVLSGISVIASGSACIAEIVGQGIFEGGNGIEVIDLVDGSSISSFPNSSVAKEFEPSPMGDVMFATRVNGNDVEFVTIDLTNGIPTVLGIVPNAMGIVTGSSAFDMFNNYYIFVSGAGIVVMDITSGNVAGTYPNPGNIQGFDFDQRSNLCYATYINGPVIEIVSFDASNGTITTIASLPVAAQNILIASGVVDPIANTYSVSTDDGVYVIDLFDGSIIANFTDPNNNQNFSNWSAPSAQITVLGDTLLCPGQTTVLQVDTNFQYTDMIWSNGQSGFQATVFQTGIYTCSVAYGACVNNFGPGVNIVTVDSLTNNSLISGTVKVDGNPVTNGGVKLIKVTLGSGGQLADSVGIAPDGTYVFNNVHPGAYLVRAKVETGQFPNAIPTYHDSAVMWVNADFVNLLTACNDTFMGIDVNVRELPALFGTGIINGVLSSSGSGKTAGDPVPGVDLTLEQVPGGIVAHDETDENGEFEFSNLENGTYKITCDMAGFEMDTLHELNFTDDDQEIDVEVCIDTDSVNIDLCTIAVGITSISNLASSKVYPNPNNGKFIVKNNNPIQGYRIFDLMGNLITQRKENDVNTITVEQLSSGCYILEVELSTKTEQYKVVVE